MEAKYHSKYVQKLFDLNLFKENHDFIRENRNSHNITMFLNWGGGGGG
jgi:hypothetical protein